jgi:hypothetical protein
MANATEKIALVGLASLVLSFVHGCALISPRTSSRPVEIKEERKLDRKEAVQATQYKAARKELRITNPHIAPPEIGPGGTIVQEMEYTTLSPRETDSGAITQVISITDGKDFSLVLLNRSLDQKQGTYSSRMTIILPQDLDPGAYGLIAKITFGELSKSVKGSFKLLKGDGVRR